MNEPLAREKVERKIIEPVFDDLVGVGLDPERDERHLVHQALELCVVCPIAIGGAFAAPATIGAAEQLRRIILDAQNVAPVERFVADECVLAFLELEAQEIRGRDELGLSRLFQQSVQFDSGGRRWSSGTFRGNLFARCRPVRFGGRR